MKRDLDVAMGDSVVAPGSRHARVDLVGDALSDNLGLNDGNETSLLESLRK